VNAFLVWDYVTSLNVPDLVEKLPQQMSTVRVIWDFFKFCVCFITQFFLPALSPFLFVILSYLTMGVVVCRWPCLIAETEDDLIKRLSEWSYYQCLYYRHHMAILQPSVHLLQFPANHNLGFIHIYLHACVLHLILPLTNLTFTLTLLTLLTVTDTAGFCSMCLLLFILATIVEQSAA